jgi:uncharacterized protein (TIGR03790 family)
MKLFIRVHSCLFVALIFSLHAQTASNVLLVVNRKDPISLQVGDYYRAKRSIPPQNICFIDCISDEEIDWRTYQEQIEKPVGNCLKNAGLQESVLYIATTLGVPLKIAGAEGGITVAEQGSVDSELALLYGKLKGVSYPRKGVVPNPYFGKGYSAFKHPLFPMYLVTRLAAYNLNEVKAMIDRSLAARNRGKFVLDLRMNGDEQGDERLRDAAILLPTNRVVMDETRNVLYGQKDVIGYASWGSNDKSRKNRWLGFTWLPGAIATEYVSTNGRTLKPPPANWNYPAFEDRAHFYAGTHQGLAADFIHEGATGAAGNVYEPFLNGCPRPDYLLPAYYEGHNLAESFYIALQFLSWQSVILGDPLCSLGKPDGK